MAKLELDPPERTDYAGQDGDTVRQTILAGGAPRTRRDKIGTARRYNVQWVLDRNEFLYFNAFYNTKIGEGSMPFEIDLIVDDLELTEHTAVFIKGTLQRPRNVTGKTATVSAQLSVIPNIVNDALNNAIVDAWAGGQREDIHLITAPTETQPTANGIMGDRTDAVGSVINWDITQFFNGNNLSYSTTGLPSGLSVGNASGLMTGTLGQTQPSTPVTITATNTGGSFTQTFNWTVV